MNRCINCKSTERRQEIIKIYKLKPRAHMPILKNQEKYSCTGAKLTDRYYIFEYENKANPKEKGSFYCGYHAAKDFLRLLKHDELPLFNPLISVSNNTTTSNGATCNFEQKEKWNKTAFELYNAICMISLCWDKPTYGFLLDLKESLFKNKNSEPHRSNIMSVNTVIKNGGKGKTLTEMINELRVDNPRLRHFSFKTLELFLKEKSNEVYF